MDEFSQKLEAFWEVLIEYDGYKDVLLGLKNTMLIAVMGLLIGTVIGTFIAAVRVMPKYRLMPRILDKICGVYVSFFRGTPIVVQLLLFYYVLLPLMKQQMDPLIAAIIVFGLNSGAYISEIMRGGILSVDPGQMEGGRAMGLSFSATMLKIVIPQAVKNILPTMGNEFITLVKETSVVSFISAVDLYKAFRSIGSSNYEYIVPFLAMAIIYIALVMLITLGIKLLERRLRKSDRSM